MNNTTKAQASGDVMNFRRQGYLAYVHCGKRLPLMVLKTIAYYIGTADDDGPCSRESVEYFASEEDANAALRAGEWTQKQYP
jgi:hypothetical protein